jgi:tetratricopeptide (TPR) repeat protein
METLIRLVYALSNNGRAEEARQWGQRGTALLARLGGESRLAVDLLGNMGTLALMQGQYKEASESYDKARGLLASLGPDDVRHSKVIFSLGLAALRLGEHPRAIELISKSLQLTEADKGKLHPEVAMRHTMLATTYRESGDLDKALSHAQTALEIRKTTLGPEHPMVAESLDELGMILIALKRYDEALASSQRAVELKNKALGPDHPDLSYSYDGIGQALLEAGRAAEAIEPLQKALAYPEVEPEALAQTGFALAKALWAVGQEPVRAREVAAQARERYVKLEKPQQVAELDAWLGSHQEVPVVKPVKGVKKKKERTPKRRRL